MTFNSLGSNYNFVFALRALFAPNQKKDAERLKDFLESKYQGKTVLLSKGRGAIALGLKILNLPAGSSVAINGYTCYAVWQAVIEAGFGVEYLDIPPDNLNFSPASLKEKLERNAAIKTVIIQNTLGYPAEIQAIAELCREKNIFLIEDLAHSIGTIYQDGQEAGTVGDIVILSFSQDKIVDGVSGGALIVRNKKCQDFQLPRLVPISRRQRITDRWYPLLTLVIRKTYAYGSGRPFHKILKCAGLLSQPMGTSPKIVFHELPGWYCRLTYDCFQNLSANLAHRRTIARIYASRIHRDALFPGLCRQISGSTHLRFPLSVEKRDGLVEYLGNHGIHVSDIWYDAPVAPKKFLKLTDYHHQCPHAEELSGRMINLPTHMNVSEQQAKNIAAKINAWMKSL